jgi:hypothetical protein
VVAGTLTAASVISGNRQSSESNVVHDHIRLCQHQIAAVACIGIPIGAWHMQYAGPTGGGETVCGSSSSVQLSPGRGSTEMINDRRPDTNRKILVKGVGENLLPPAQALWLWWPGPAVAAPDTGNSHIDLVCYLTPSQALVTQLGYLINRSGMSLRAATSHGDAGSL